MDDTADWIQKHAGMAKDAFMIAVQNVSYNAGKLDVTIPEDGRAVKAKAQEADMLIFYDKDKMDMPHENCPEADLNLDSADTRKYNMFSGKADVSITIDQKTAEKVLEAGCAIAKNNPKTGF